MRALSFAVLFAACAFSLPGCAGGGSGSVALSWQFSDGRSCADSGAASIAVEVDGRTLSPFDCSAGFLPAAVNVNAALENATIRVQALSPESASLYAGSLSPGALPVSATVILYADKMR